MRTGELRDPHRGLDRRLALSMQAEPRSSSRGLAGSPAASATPGSPGPAAASVPEAAPLARDVLTLVINLDRSPERLRRIAQRMDELGLAWTRLPAVDGAALGDAERAALDERGYRRLHGSTPKPGELGCYLSHLRAMRALLASDARFALILEDDALPSERLPGVLADLVRVAHRWDMVKLSKVHDGTPVAVCELGNGASLDVMLTRCTGSSAYIVNRRAAQVYLDRLLPIRLPYDHAFDRGWRLGLEVRLVSPPPCRHDSEIASTIASHPGGTRPGRARAARAKPPWYRRLPAFAYRAANELMRVGAGLRAVLRSRLGSAR